MPADLTVISSMATKTFLSRAAALYGQRSGECCDVLSVGGVEAMKRLQAGERHDVAVLAADAIDTLLAEGHLVAGSRSALFRSSMAIAVKAGVRRPDVASAEALRAALAGAPSIGYSTGPSGTALVALIERWGLADALHARLVRAAPGVPVGELVARGDAALGFQQRSELIHVDGIELLGDMPAGLEIVTTFAAGIGRHCQRRERAAAWLDFLRSPDLLEPMRAEGVEPATAHPTHLSKDQRP